jgi:hypothetical protein
MGTLIFETLKIFFTNYLLLKNYNVEYICNLSIILQ